MTFTSRKRSRSSEQNDVCEFSPISKRINNIHIRSNGTKLLQNPEEKGCEEKVIHDAHGAILTNGNQHGQQQTNHYPDMNYVNNACDPQQPSFSGQSHHQLTNGHPSTVTSLSAYNINNSLPNGTNQWIGGEGADGLLPFEPELDERQNPIYYHVNEMLYQLHVERMKRITK